MKHKGTKPISIVILISILSSISALGFGSFRLYQIVKNNTEKAQLREAQQKMELQKIIGDNEPLKYVDFDTTPWNTYKNQAYGFQIKYPEDWSEPTVENGAGKNVDYQAKIVFRKTTDNSEIARRYEVANWQNYRDLTYGLKIKYPEKLGLQNNLPQMSLGHARSISPAITPLQKIQGFDVYVYKNKPLTNLETSQKICFEKEKVSRITELSPKDNYYYTAGKDDYSFKISPVLENNIELFGQTDREKIEKELPEFLSSISTFGFQKEPIFPRKTTFKRTFFALKTCGAKNDHPQKSTRGKGKHIDEDCCPDPDEWPLPGCSYSAKGLALMLGGPKLSKK